MPSIDDTEQSRREFDNILRKAIMDWRPDRPRRWLTKYGNWPVEGRGSLAERYRTIRLEAKALLARPRIDSANGLASHTYHLE